MGKQQEKRASNFRPHSHLGKGHFIYFFFMLARHKNLSYKSWQKYEKNVTKM